MPLVMDYEVLKCRVEETQSRAIEKLSRAMTIRKALDKLFINTGNENKKILLIHPNTLQSLNILPCLKFMFPVKLKKIKKILLTKSKK